MKLKRSPLLAGLLLSLAVSPAFGQFTDVVTGSNLGEPMNLLYRSSPATPENLAPVGSELWFVSDSGAGGVPTGLVDKQMIDAITARTADDKLFATGLIDGADTLVNAPGRFQESNINYPASDQNKPVFVYLWSDSHGGDVGDTFGLLELTSANGRIVAPVGIGNFEFHVDTEIFADTFTVVPEPGACATVVGLFCVAGAVVRSFSLKRSR